MADVVDNQYFIKKIGLNQVLGNFFFLCSNFVILGPDRYGIFWLVTMLGSKKILISKISADICINIS